MKIHMIIYFKTYKIELIKIYVNRINLKKKKFLRESQGHRSPIHWLHCREEPCLYMYAEKNILLLFCWLDEVYI
jgi:hypothetical protein